MRWEWEAGDQASSALTPWKPLAHVSWPINLETAMADLSINYSQSPDPTEHSFNLFTLMRPKHAKRVVGSMLFIQKYC